MGIRRTGARYARAWRGFLLFTLLVVLLLFPQGSLRAQGSDRIWGRVQTLSGESYEGFIRWDRNEGSWIDLLSGDKAISLDSMDFRIWNEEADSAEVPPDRVIEFGGVRITWPDLLEDFPTSASSGVRFGHLRRLVPLEGDSVRLELRSGEVLVLSGGSTDLGPEVRQILVDVPGMDVVELGWEDLAAVDFRASPPSVRPKGERIFGTVKDRFGNDHTGFVAWNAEKILTTDSLVGRSGPRERRIPFGRVFSVVKTVDGALVTLDNGESLSLTESDDVTRGNGGIQVADVGLGTVEMDWRDFESVRFRAPDHPSGYSEFDGGHPLRGTVVTLSGETLGGMIRFDADEAYSWELLDGIRDHETFDIEFGNIVLVEPIRSVAPGGTAGQQTLSARERWRGARVTLADGRVLELDGTNDVDESNKGVLVRAEGADSGPWILVEWKDVRELRLRGLDG